MSKTKRFTTLIPKILFIFSLFVLVFAFGYFSRDKQFFPHSSIAKARKLTNDLIRQMKGIPEFYYQKTDKKDMVSMYSEPEYSSGNTLISCFEDDYNLSVKVVNPSGETIHKWDVDWFKVWPDAKHIPKKDLPKKKPGTHIHGSLLMPNGDLVYSYEYLGLIRMDLCGNVIWRLPYRTHHSVCPDKDWNLWVPGQIHHDKKLKGYPNLKPPFIEPTLLKVSPDGKVLTEISLLKLLVDNNLEGLIYLNNKSNRNTKQTGDFIHFNDIEVFPADMKEDFFKEGDLALSLRNLNTIIIVNSNTWKVKKVYNGSFVRQHDPDFIDGNTISFYDNRNIAPARFGQQSRIVTVNFATGEEKIVFEGNPSIPFYSFWMGNHQYLPNGNLLLNETMHGRVIELDSNMNLVWEYNNLIGKGWVGITEEAMRLPAQFTKEYFEEETKKCKSN